MRLRNSPAERPRAFPEGPPQGCRETRLLHRPPSHTTLATNLRHRVCPAAGPSLCPLPLRNPAPRLREAADTEGSPHQAMATATPSGWEQGPRSPGPGHFHLNGRGRPRAPQRCCRRQSLELEPGHGTGQGRPARRARGCGPPSSAPSGPRRPPLLLVFRATCGPGPAQPPPASIETFYPPADSWAPPLSAPPVCV